MKMSPEMLERFLKERSAEWIKEINGAGYTGDGSEEDPLLAVEGKTSLENLITSVLLYAKFFKIILFFSYEGVIAEYDPEDSVFSVETDRKNALRTALGNVLKGNSRGIKIVESKPLLQVLIKDK